MNISDTFFETMESILKNRILKDTINSLDFKVEVVNRERFSEKFIRITPVNSKAARMVINVLDNWNGINLWVGEFMIFEFFPQEKNIIEEFEKYCLAIVNGQVTEDLWYKDSEIIKSIGKIYVNNKESKVVHAKAFHNPFKKVKHKIIQYEPYARTENGPGHSKGTG